MRLLPNETIITNLFYIITETNNIRYNKLYKPVIVIIIMNSKTGGIEEGIQNYAALGPRQ